MKEVVKEEKVMNGFRELCERTPVVVVPEWSRTYNGMLWHSYGLMLGMTGSKRYTVLSFSQNPHTLPDIFVDTCGEVKAIGIGYGMKELYRMMILRELSVERGEWGDNLRHRPVSRLPDFEEWWDGNDLELLALLDRMKYSKRCAKMAVLATLGLQHEWAAAQVIGDESFSWEVRIAAFAGAANEETRQILCDEINAVAGMKRAIDIFACLGPAIPLIDHLVMTGNVKMIAPMLDAVEQIGNWRNRMHPIVIKAVDDHRLEASAQ